MDQRRVAGLYTSSAATGLPFVPQPPMTYNLPEMNATWGASRAYRMAGSAVQDCASGL